MMMIIIFLFLTIKYLIKLQTNKKIMIQIIPIFFKKFSVFLIKYFITFITNYLIEKFNFIFNLFFFNFYKKNILHRIHFYNLSLYNNTI